MRSKSVVVVGFLMATVLLAGGCKKKEKWPPTIEHAIVHQRGSTISIVGQASFAKKLDIQVKKGKSKIPTEAIKWKGNGRFNITFDKAKLQPGRYVIHLVAVKGSQRSKPKEISFRVSRPRVDLSLTDGKKQGAPFVAELYCYTKLQNKFGSPGPHVKPTKITVDNNGEMHFKFTSKQITSIAIGGSPGKTTAKSATGSYPVMKRLWKRTLPDIQKKGLKIPVRLETKFMTFKGHFDCTGLLDILEPAARQGKWLLKKPSGKPAILLFDKKKRLILGDNSKPLAALDYIARISEFTKSYGTCKYRSRSTGKTMDVEKQAVHLYAKILDRRTGKVVGEKTWKAKKPKCKVKLVGKQYLAMSFYSNKAYRAARKWIAKKLN